MKSFIICAFVLSVAALSSGKVYERCELARELVNRYHFNRDYVHNWVCVVKGESSFRTFLTNPYNSDGSTDWGLFQINDRYWCQAPSGTPSSNMCNISCDKFLDDDISDDVSCALKVYNAHEYRGWVAYERHCLNAPRVDDCF